MNYSAGRLKVRRYGFRDGDSIDLRQTHNNGSDEVVGKLQLNGDEIEDALYVLNRAKADRDRERDRKP